MFTCSEFEGEPKAGSEGDIMWVNRSDIPTANVYPGDRVFLDKIFSKNFVVIDFAYDGFTYLSSTTLTEL